MDNLNVLDIAIVVIICLSMLMGVIRGFVKEALSVGAWVISTWAAVTFGDEVSSTVSTMIDSNVAVLIISYGGLFFGSLIVASLINFIIANVVKMTGFTFTDKIAGMAFGLIRGALFISIIGLVAHFMEFDQASWWSSSSLIDYFTPMSDWLAQFIPTDIPGLENLNLPNVEMPSMPDMPKMPEL